MQNVEIQQLDEVFVSDAVVDETVESVDRYLRKPSGTSDQGYRED